MGMVAHAPVPNLVPSYFAGRPLVQIYSIRLLTIFNYSGFEKRVYLYDHPSFL